MKHLLLILYISMAFNFISSGKENLLENIPKDILECLDKMGNDIYPTLNECECKYLDYYFQKNKGIFSFCGRKVYFLKGNTGTIKSDKKEYFEEIKLIISTGILPSLSMQQLAIFDECEVKDIGYEVVIVSGSKKYLTKKDIVKRLKSNKQPK
jgi:hypothetical protein